MSTMSAVLHSRRTLSNAIRSSALVFALASATMSACTLTPRDGELVTDMDQRYSGYHRFPNDTLFVQYFNTQTSTWDSIKSTRSSSTPSYTDPCGYAWYSWQVDLTLPNLTINGPYWFLGWSYIIRSRVVASSGGILRSFDESADECIEQYECAPQILQYCGNDTGEISLICDGCSS